MKVAKTIVMKVVMIFVFLFTLTACSPKENTVEKGVTAVYPPMIMFDGTLYIIYPYPEGLNADLYDIEEVGTIESQCFGGVPAEDNQANYDYIGSKIIRVKDDENILFLYSEGEYTTFMKHQRRN